MNKEFTESDLALALTSLAIRLEQNSASPIEIVVCGGSALILTGLITRTTEDVDIVALWHDGHLISPDPLPAELKKAALEVAEDLSFSLDWLNNKPSRSEGGLFQLGLPQQIGERLKTRSFGSHLRVHFISRFDQIHFKLYASADRGGYHINDLLALDPSPEELEAAARWAMTHDVSEGFSLILKDMLRELGHGIVADRL